MTWARVCWKLWPHDTCAWVCWKLCLWHNTEGAYLSRMCSERWRVREFIACVVDLLLLPRITVTAFYWLWYLRWIRPPPLTHQIRRSVGGTLFYVPFFKQKRSKCFTLASLAERSTYFDASYCDTAIYQCSQAIKLELIPGKFTSRSVSEENLGFLWLEKQKMTSKYGHFSR